MPVSIAELEEKLVLANNNPKEFFGADIAATLKELHGQSAAVTANSVEKALTPYSKTERGKSSSISVASSGAPSGLSTV